MLLRLFTSKAVVYWSFVTVMCSLQIFIVFIQAVFVPFCPAPCMSAKTEERHSGEVRYGALYAPVKPNRVLANGMQAHNALHSSNSQRRNSFDSVECPAPGALSSSAACLPPSPVSLLLMLSIWRFMQKCAASRPPWSPSILSAGTPACHKLSYAEIVKLRLLASCLTEAFLSVHFKQG